MSIEQSVVITEPATVILIAVVSNNEVEVLPLTWLSVSVDTDVCLAVAFFPVGCESKMLPLTWSEDFIG